MQEMLAGRDTPANAFHRPTPRLVVWPGFNEVGAALPQRVVAARLDYPASALPSSAPTDAERRL